VKCIHERVEERNLRGSARLFLDAWWHFLPPLGPGVEILLQILPLGERGEFAGLVF